MFPFPSSLRALLELATGVRDSRNHHLRGYWENVYPVFDDSRPLGCSGVVMSPLAF